MAEEQATSAIGINKAALWVLIGGLLPAAVSTVSYFLMVADAESNRFFSLILLLIPSLLTCAGVVTLLEVRQSSGRLVIGIGIFEVLKNILILLYACAVEKKMTPLELPALSSTALLAAISLVYLVFRLTAWGMRDVDANSTSAKADTKTRKEQARDAVVQQLIRHRFLAVGGLLVAFLDLAIFLSLSIAFHNLSTGQLALQRKVAKIEKSSVPATALASAGLPETERQYVFLFREGSASLQCSSVIDVTNIGESFWSDPPAARYEFLQARTDLVRKECASERAQISWNLVELHSLQSDLDSLYKRAGSERYRAVVLAHASEEAPQVGFGSNYELSRARAEQIQATVETMMAKIQRRSGNGHSPLNLEWLLLPVSSEKTFLLPERHVKRKQIKEVRPRVEHQLSAEIEILQIPKHLTALQADNLAPFDPNAKPYHVELLDYLYFVVGSAGYGDLMPTTGYIQFVVCIAKVFECFFLVIAFNVILTLRPEPLKQVARAQAGEDEPKA
jgi:hypothetical protein